MGTVAEEALEACGGDKGRLLLLTTPLLEWVCHRQLPVEARISVSQNSQFSTTVEPPIKDTPNKEHLSIKDKSTCPNSYYTSAF